MPIPLIPVGAPANAATFNAPLQALSANVDSALSMFEAASLGKSYCFYDAPIRSDVVVGTPVFWNSVTSQYEPGLASVTTDNYGQFITSPSSDIVGIIIAVHPGNLGDVLIEGVANINLANVVSGPVVPGRYYLSSSTPGQLVGLQPPISIFVCRVLGQLNSCATVAQVLVKPQIRDVLLDHAHYRFPLACLPAGKTTPPAYGQNHVINSPDPTKIGWLPANHPVFNGLAPHNAVFGYNISKDPNLSQFWPPVPVWAVAVLLDNGTRYGATEIPQGPNGLVICDANGIWWMSSCYGDAPWPVGLNNTVVHGSSYPNAYDYDECPRIDHMRIEVVYLRMLVMNANYVVTSLSTPPGGPLVLTGTPSPAGETGNVTIAFNPTAATQTNNALGGLVVKGITPQLNIQEGWVLEGITTSSPAVVLGGSQTRHLTPTDPTTPLVYQGIVSVDMDPNPVDKELTPALIRLETGAVDRLFEDIPYIGFPANKTTSIRMSFNIPPQGIASPSVFQLRLLMLGRTSGTLTAFTASYRQLAMPADNTAEAITATDTSFTINTAIPVTNGQLAQAQSAAISVMPGDTLFVTITRPTDVTFNGEIGLVRITGVVSVNGSGL